MASAQVKPSSRRQEVAEAGRRKLEQFRKQKAAKKASQSNNTTTQPVVSDSHGDVVVASIMSNGQSAESSGGFDQRDDFSKGASPSSGSTLLSTSLQMNGFMHGGGSISSPKDSLQPTTRMAGFVHEVDKNEHGSGQLRGGSSIVQKSSSYLFTSPETSSRPSEPSDYSLNIASSSPLYSAINESSAKRNRPSFLDSLNISRAPETQYQHPGKEADLATPSGSQLTGGDGFGLSSRQHVPGKIDSNGPSFTSESLYPFEKSRSPLFPFANGVMPGFTDYSMPKQNDDFSTLEQHIEDLTQKSSHCKGILMLHVLWQHP